MPLKEKLVPADLSPAGATSSVGAGDTFIAGMLYGLVCREKTWPLDQSVRFAVNLATLKVQREGFEGLGADMMALATV